MLYEALDIASSSRTLRTYHCKALEFCFVIFLEETGIGKNKRSFGKGKSKTSKNQRWSLVKEGMLNDDVVHMDVGH